MHIKVCSFGKYSVKCSDCCFAAFQGKSFLPNVFGMQELFKNHTLVEHFEYAFTFFKTKWFEKILLHFPRQEIYFLLVTDIFKFYPHMRGITTSEVLMNIP